MPCWRYFDYKPSEFSARRLCFLEGGNSVHKVKRYGRAFLDCISAYERKRRK
nr:hypothetical protein [uncultured Butyricicoccus sp.]